jgi:hypothetical protein
MLGNSKQYFKERNQLRYLSVTVPILEGAVGEYTAKFTL